MAVGQCVGMLTVIYHLRTQLSRVRCAAQYARSIKLLLQLYAGSHAPVSVDAGLYEL